MEKVIRIGIDTSKHVFQLHGVNSTEEPVLRRRLRRSEMVRFFAKLPATVIGLEACGGAHHWGAPASGGRLRHGSSGCFDKLSTRG